MMYVTGDTHLNIDIEKLNTRKFVEGKTLTKDDILIICGDVGLTWDRSNEVKYWKDWLNKKHWTTICCDGNHENFDELYTYPLVPWNGGYVRKISDSVFYLNRGDVFNINGKKIFVMGGATSIDKDYRIEGRSWWAEEMPNYKEQEYALNNLDKNNWEVDYVITHCAPTNVLYQINPSFQADNLTNFLYEIYKKLDYKEWYFGHYHIDKDFDKHHCLYQNVVKIL